MQPEVSIVLTIGDSGRSGAIDAITSVLEQTISELEILVINSGSGYGVSIGLQEDYTGNERVLFVNLRDNAGTSTRNLALKQIRGQYVCFMDAGERWNPDKLAHQLSILKSDPKNGAVISNGKFIRTEGKKVSGGNLFADGSNDPACWLISCPAMTSGQVLYSFDALRELGYFNSNCLYLSDLNMLCKCSEMFNVVIDDTDVMKCFINITQAARRQYFLEYEQIIKNVKYIDLLLSDKKYLAGYYFNLTALAAKARMIIEAMQYLFVSIARAPIISAKHFGGTVLSLIRGRTANILNHRLLEKYASQIRGDVLGLKKSSEYRTYDPGSKKAGIDMAAVLERISQVGGEHVIAPFEYMGIKCSDPDGRIVIPSDIRDIGEGAFAGCRGLKHVVISDNVTQIGPMAFMDCEDLEIVEFSPKSNLAKISSYAFAGCVNLKKVILPGDMSAIGKGAFIGCSSLEKLVFSPGTHMERSENIFAERVSRIEAECFAGCSKLDDIHFDSGSLMSYIGSYAFFNCYSLKLIWIESSVYTIGDHAFDGCENVSEIIMPLVYKVSYLGSYSFAHCKELRQFTFPSAISIINDGVFKCCSKLTSCSIPDTVKKIKKESFVNCSSLYLCVINNKDAKVSKKAFDKHTKVVFSK